MSHTNTFIHNVPISSGGLTVIVANTAEEMLRHSSGFATTLHKKGPGVLLVNCGLARERFNRHTEHIRKYSHNTKRPSDYKPRLAAFTSTVGNLIEDDYLINSLCAHARAAIVIIVGWEWSASTHTRREKLLCFLREMLDSETTIIIYTQTRTKPVAGRIDRGGIGKLGTLANDVISVDAAIKGDEIAPAEMAAVATSENMEEVGKRIRSVMNDINHLEEKPSEDSKEPGYPLNDDKQETFDGGAVAAENSLSA